MPDEALRAVYQELCSSYRAIDDFRMKLLGFLPVATGAGVVLLSDALTDEKKRQLAIPYLGPVGVFGFVTTLGLFLFELHGIKKCHYLIHNGKGIEAKLGIDGQFSTRPRGVFGVINEPFAAGVVYPAVMAAWAYVARVGWWPDSAPWAAAGIFLGGHLFVLFYDWLLKRHLVWV